MYHALYVGLIGGSSDNEGRVEVNFNGEWGTVCDDFWSTNDANVACRQLGFGTAVSVENRAAFGQGSGTIWLDNLQCSGSETDLFSCPHNGPGSHNCGHSEDAGVVCSNIRKYNPLNITFYCCRTLVTLSNSDLYE